MYKNMGKVKRTLEEYAILTVATLILVVGVYVFKFPNNFSFGGVTGIAVVLSAVMPATPGNITFIINMVLLVVGFIFLGKSFGIRTVYVSVLMSVGLSLAEVWFPMEHPLTTQPVLELMYAIVLPAFSAAIMFNIGASGGGTDIIAMILKKYTKLNIGGALFLVDLGIVIASCFVFDAQTGLCSRSRSLWTMSLKVSTCASILRSSAMIRSPSVILSRMSCTAVQRSIKPRGHMSTTRRRSLSPL